MAVNIKVKQGSIQKAMDQIRKMSDEYEGKIKETVHEGARSIESKARQNHTKNGSRVQGDLVRSIQAEYDQAKPSANVHVGVYYAPYVEFGTKSKAEIPTGLGDYAAQFRKGHDGKFEQLLKAIEKWASKKGLPKEAAYPIARQIAREGSEPHPFLFPAFDEMRGKIIQRLKKIPI